MKAPSNARHFRRFVFQIISGILIFITSILLLLWMHQLLLPFILGVFMAYLFQPLANRFKGSSFAKFSKIGIFVLFVFVSGYWGARIVKVNLPNEKEKLELLVRLQYRFNERYHTLMNINTETNKGNFIYENFKSELDPMVAKANDFLTLSPEQIRLFFLYRKGYNGQPPISDKFYEYFVKNITLTEETKEKLLNDTQQNGAKDSLSTAEAVSGGLFNMLHNFSVWLVFPLTFMFMLFDKGQALRSLVRLIPNRYFELSLTVIHRVDTALGKYIRGTLMECLLVGLTLALGFFISGMKIEMAILIGFVGGITNAIPFFGTVIACLVGCTYALIAENVQPLIPFLNSDSLMLAVIGVVLIAHLLDNAVFQPLVLGGAVNLHPLVVILGVFGGSMAFGLVGMILAIPTIVIVKVVSETFVNGLKAYRII